MPIERQTVAPEHFNPSPVLPYNLRIDDFRLAMQDIYDFLFDVNAYLVQKRLPRLDDSLRKQTFTGMVSDMVAEALAKHSRSLVRNLFHNGHPDLLVGGEHPGDRARAADEGIEVKATVKRGGAVDTHGGRDQWMLVFVYAVDHNTEPATAREPMRFVEIYLNRVTADDFRRNERGELGTRTSTLDRDGLARLRQGWVYYEPPAGALTRSAANLGIAR